MGVLEKVIEIFEIIIGLPVLIIIWGILGLLIVVPLDIFAYIFWGITPFDLGLWNLVIAVCSGFPIFVGMICFSEKFKFLEGLLPEVGTSKKKRYTIYDEHGNRKGWVEEEE
jgi:hypothetical protein